MIKKCILWMFSQTPILNATHKENFGSGDQWQDLNLFSILFLNIGSMRVFFLSYDSAAKNFRMYRVLRYSDIVKWPTTIGIQDVMQRNIAKFIDQNIPAFEYKLAQEAERYSIAMGKIPNYITVVVFVIPLYYVLFVLFEKYCVAIGFAILAVYLLIGCIVITCHIMSVKGSDRATLSELIDKAAESKYFDWQIRKRENDYYVGLVKNLERMLLFSMIFAVLSSVFGLASSSIEPTKAVILDIARDSSRVKEQRLPKADSIAMPMGDLNKSGKLKVNPSDSTKKSLLNLVVKPTPPPQAKAPRRKGKKDEP